MNKETSATVRKEYKAPRDILANQKASETLTAIKIIPCGYPAVLKNCALHELVAEILQTATEEEVGQFVPSSANESSEAGTEDPRSKDPRHLELTITIDVNHSIIKIYNQSYWMTVK